MDPVKVLGRIGGILAVKLRLKEYNRLLRLVGKLLLKGGL